MQTCRCSEFGGSVVCRQKKFPGLAIGKKGLVIKKYHQAFFELVKNQPFKSVYCVF